MVPIRGLGHLTRRTALEVTTVVATGDGSIVAPPPGENLVEMELRGNVKVVVAADSIVNVIGDASVPTGYVPTEEGFRSSEGEPTLVIRVVSGEVAVEVAQ